MNTETIKELRRLLGEATPGEWNQDEMSLVNRDLGDEYDPEEKDFHKLPSWDIGEIYAPQNRALICAAVNALPALLDALEGAMVDAERYRWVRKRFRIMSLDISGQHGYVPTGEIGRIKGPSFDAAIDAAREKEKQP